MKNVNGKYIKAILLSFLFGFSVIHANLSSASDMTSSVQIKSSGIIFNRATNTFDSIVTITNIGPSLLLKPFQLVVTLIPQQVALVNKTGITNQGKTYVEVISSSGILNQGQSITAQLKISNPSQVKFSATFSFDAQTPQTGNLPPDPGEAGKLTIAGIDSDKDGTGFVMIFRSISTKPIPTLRRRGARYFLSRKPIKRIYSLAQMIHKRQYC
jgi:hypothetical protein